MSQHGDGTRSGVNPTLPENREEIKKAARKQKEKSPMPMQDPEIRIHNFSEVELGYDFDLAFNEVPAPSTLLGVKGGGEGGTTAAPPAVINAIVDALSEFGVRHIEMPATPEKIWRAIQEGRGGGG